MNPSSLSAASTWALHPAASSPELLPARARATLPHSSKHLLLKPLKDRLLRQLDRGHIEQAFHLLDEMSQRGVPPDLVTHSLLRSCIRRRDLRRGRLLHRRLLHSGLQLDSIVCNSLIALYSKCGELELAREVFHDMGSMRDLVSWSSMISGCVSNGMVWKAVGMFKEMMELGFQPNDFCLGGLLQGLCSVEYVGTGLVVFGIAVKTGYFGAGVSIGCALIDMFAKTGDLVSARKVFHALPERNVVVWTLLMTRYLQQGHAQDSIKLFVELLVHGLQPDQFTMSSVITACTELGSHRLGLQLHAFALRMGLHTDVCVGCSLVDMYAKSMVGGSISESQKAFDSIPEHNVMSWTSLITGCVHNRGHDHEAIDLYCRMIEGTVRPNHFTFSSVLKACANLGDADIGAQVYGHVVKSGLSMVNFVGNSLVSMFAKSGQIAEARKAFNIMFDKSLVSYNTMIDGYVKNSSSEDAFDLLQQIESSDLGGNAFTFASLLSAAAGIGSISKGQQLHGHLLKLGFRFDQGAGNALLSMYSRCGSIEDAWLAFSEMDNRNVISWTSMIDGFAKHGYADRALRLFHQMIKAGVEPNDITYVAVLSACSHAGLICQGWEHFHTMQTDHKITPKMDHYACMVDLLGRSGNLEEAMHFINSMPFKADALIWRTLLGACQIRSNMKMGEVAAKEILELDPDDPAAHVLLSNLYASKGKWDGVAEIRSSMKQRSLTKEAGVSWMEIESTIHEFYVGDTRHPRVGEIYDKLDEMALEIKRMGYVPDLDHVLHELEEEQKEQYLFQHSERIAVAFGLISTSAPKPIRIFKNLRVCGDCHQAIKFVSKVYGRVIVLRDTNRFHCFTDGVCSCGDYW